MGIFSWIFGKKKSKSDKKEEAVIKNETLEKDIMPTEPAKSEPVKSEEIVKANAPSPTPAKKNETGEKREASTSVKKAETTKTVGTTPAPAPVEAPKPKNDTISASENYTGRFEINKSKDGKKYFFNLYASNKVGIATSQMYSTAQSALIGVKSVIANAAKAPIEDQTLKTYEELPFPKWIIYLDKGGKYRFHLSAANGSNVCHSQGYTTKSSCKNGIESIIRSSKNAEIDKNYLIKKPIIED